MSHTQLDLFEETATPLAVVAQPVAELRIDVEALGDAELIDALPHAGLHDSFAIMGEIARRRLASGVPAVAAICRRHAGFGRSRIDSEQKIAVETLGSIGGREASQAIARLIERDVFAGPGLIVALQAAVRLASPIAEPIVANLLRADDPDVRATAARCVRRWPKCAPLLIELLQDLHDDVRIAAACALGRTGSAAARPVLLAALREQPTRDVVEAIVEIADPEVLVLLGRTAETRQDLAGLIGNALDGIDHPLAATIAARLRQ